MTDHVVTATGSGVAEPYIVAIRSVQRSRLVRLALRDQGHTGVYAGVHDSATFYVWNRPVITMPLDERARRFLQVGYFAGLAGALFYDETTPEGADWAWLALRPTPFPDPPKVYFDQPSQIEFPPRCVMPIDEVRDVVLEFVNTGERPASVEWLTVNSLTWKLDGLGDVALSPDMS